MRKAFVCYVISVAVIFITCTPTIHITLSINSVRSPRHSAVYAERAVVVALGNNVCFCYTLPFPSSSVCFSRSCNNLAWIILANQKFNLHKMKQQRSEKFCKNYPLFGGVLSNSVDAVTSILAFLLLRIAMRNITVVKINTSFVLLSKGSVW